MDFETLLQIAHMYSFVKYDYSFEHKLKQYIEMLQDLDEVPLNLQNTYSFYNAIFEAFTQISRIEKFDYITIPLLVELLRLNILSNYILGNLPAQTRVYDAAYRVIFDNYSNLKFEDLHYIPHKLLMRVQAVTDIPELQWQIARKF